MVRALGYEQRLVFIAGSALAGLGGVMWAMCQEVITAGMGEAMMILVFIVVMTAILMWRPQGMMPVVKAK